MTFIVTVSGAKLDFVNPTVGQIIIEDIAHALAVIPRFAGHTNWQESDRAYSVAQHSLLVSSLIGLIGGSPYDQLWGLLHDASEAYMGDCNTPLKRLLPDFQAVEDRLQEVICDRFGLHHDKPQAVRWADKHAMCIEARDLHHPSLAKMFPVVEHSASAGSWVAAGNPSEVYASFMRVFHYLKKRNTQ